MSREPKKPKTAPTGKRYRCATCRKRSPQKVYHPAPWWCDRCRGLTSHDKARPPAGDELSGPGAPA